MNRVVKGFWLSALCLWGLLTSVSASAVEFAQRADLQVRLDDRSARDLRYQYRVRYYPELSLSPQWSVQGFLVTGDEFGSSHNTFDDGAADYFYPRRLYLRHQAQYGKTEVGVIPTYKGAVSASGLSKDGWIQGVRHVRKIRSADRLEVVIGELNSIDPARALRAPGHLDYFELEYSASLSEQTGVEGSLERMTGANFARAEVRQSIAGGAEVFSELVVKLDDRKLKFVLGTQLPLVLFNQPAELAAHYAYVSEDLGLRAELTEDFLGTGHAMTAELSGDFSAPRWAWFARFDATESRQRFLLGIKWSLR